MEVEIFRRGPPRERTERLLGDEALRAGRDQRDDVVPFPDEQPAQLARLVGGDSSRHAEEDPRHGSYFGYEYLSLPSEISSRAIVK